MRFAQSMQNEKRYELGGYHFLLSVHKIMRLRISDGHYNGLQPWVLNRETYIEVASHDTNLVGMLSSMLELAGTHLMLRYVWHSG